MSTEQPTGRSVVHAHDGFAVKLEAAIVDGWGTADVLAARLIESGVVADPAEVEHYAEKASEAQVEADRLAGVVAAVESEADIFHGYIAEVRATVRGKTPTDKMAGREANVWGEAERRLRAALASAADAPLPERQRFPGIPNATADAPQPEAVTDAVEAAFRALFPEWEDMLAGERLGWRLDIRAALTDALPLLRGEDV